MGTVLRCRTCSLVSLVDSVTGQLVTCAYDESYYRRNAHGGEVGYPDYFGAESAERRANAVVFARLILSLAPGAGLGQFDVVTLMDVIEHLNNPVSAVRVASRMVKPGGLLVVLTPRYGGRLLAAQGGAYVHFNHDHVYYFTEDTLRAVIDRSTRYSALRINGVLAWITERAIQAALTFLRKYRDERDSMIAVATCADQT